MNYRRSVFNRLSSWNAGILPARRYRLLSRLVGVLLLMVILSTGCAGNNRVRQVSWPGLAVEDNVVYVADVSQVLALDTESGQLFWSYPAQPDAAIGFYATPVLDKERNLLLAAGFNSRIVYALELGDTPGLQPIAKWTFGGAQGQFVGSGVIYKDDLLIGNGDGSLYAINLEDGSQAWVFDNPTDRVWATPVVLDDVVYVASLDHKLYAVQADTGALIWERELDGAIAATPVIANGALWVGDFADKFYQIDTATGEILWEFEGDDWFWASPIAVDGMIYVSDVGGTVYALDIVEKVAVWSTEVEDIVRGKVALNADGSRLFVAGYEYGQIHALDTETGQKMAWGVIFDDPGRLPGDLVADDERLYIMPILVDEQVQAFDLVDGKMLWQYPIPETK